MLNFRNSSSYTIQVSLQPLHDAHMHLNDLFSIEPYSKITIPVNEQYVNCFILEGSSILWKGSIPTVGELDWDGKTVKSNGKVVSDSFNPTTSFENSPGNQEPDHSCISPFWIFTLLLLGILLYAFL